MDAQLSPHLSSATTVEHKVPFFLHMSKVGLHARGKSWILLKSCIIYQMHHSILSCTHLSTVLWDSLCVSDHNIAAMYIHQLNTYTLTFVRWILLHRSLPQPPDSHHRHFQCGPILYVNDWPLRVTSRLYLVSAPQQLATDGNLHTRGRRDLTFHPPSSSSPHLVSCVCSTVPFSLKFHRYSPMLVKWFPHPHMQHIQLHMKRHFVHRCACVFKCYLSA